MLTRKQIDEQWQDSAARIAEAAQRAHNINLMNESNRRANATTEQLVSGDFTPKPEKPPKGGAKIIAYIMLRRCSASFSDGTCNKYEAGQRIEDLSVARELREVAELPMIPVYERTEDEQ